VQIIGYFPSLPQSLSFIISSPLSPLSLTLSISAS
jgi:hypothetical protein